MSHKFKTYEDNQNEMNKLYILCFSTIQQFFVRILYEYKNKIEEKTESDAYWRAPRESLNNWDKLEILSYI